jgi:hypothetical protein
VSTTHPFSAVILKNHLDLSRFLGCKIHEHSQTHSFGSGTYKLLNLPLYKFERDPEIILHRLSDSPIPGFCWPFKGNSGHIMLELQEPTKINEIVYSHVDRSAEPPNLQKSSPRTVEVWVSFKKLSK